MRCFHPPCSTLHAHCCCLPLVFPLATLDPSPPLGLTHLLPVESCASPPSVSQFPHGHTRPLTIASPSDAASVTRCLVWLPAETTVPPRASPPCLPSPPRSVPGNAPSVSAY
ncbi:hypothetical protein BDA96_01G394100 [Sorghum bicolor]|uniref:Secreted protein n=2 Tax=Sorghum bicolor TaxID=4558 RepID=A0A921V1D0_SORBI|nr:hypothetical protein BDA96_01G394100 [Sorghum bicolor]KXG39362.1 hypothetical protein SORBI_3001G370200 [Sorghum bicolor]